MKEVASLRYGVIFKKAFGELDIFTAFVQDVVSSAVNLQLDLQIERVETEKSFDPVVGRVATRFDLFAQDKKNRVIVDIQHSRNADHYDRFLHYHCAAILEQVAKSYDYKPPLLVYTVVVLTGGDRHQKDILITDFRPRDLEGQPVDETEHKIIYLNPKVITSKTPEPLREWMLAIADSLDEKVDENDYQREEILRVFDLIQKDTISPEERAKMIEEYHLEEGKRTAFSEGVEEGVKKGLEKGLEEGVKKGLEEGEQRKAESIARKMLALGMEAAQITTITGLNREQIVELAA